MLVGKIRQEGKLKVLGFQKVLCKVEVWVQEPLLIMDLSLSGDLS